MKVFKHLPAILISLLMVIPILCVLSSAIGVEANVWEHLLKKRIPTLLQNSIVLVSVVTVSALFLGTVLAFLVEKTNLPFRSLMRPLLIAPLIVPCYIVAICYVNFFGIKGIGEKILASIGINASLPNIYGFWGAAVLLIIGAYPYVYALVRSSIRKIDPTYSEVAKTMGIGRLERIKRIILPLLVPALSGGAILAALYVLSDFGVVSLLRFPTFVSTIYEQMSGRYDYSTATSLSSVLLILTLFLFVFQESLIKNRQYVSAKSKIHNVSTYNLKYFRWPAFAFVLFIVIVGLVIPVSVLIYWTVNSLKVSKELGIWTISMGELLKSSFNSLTVSAIVASLAVLFALPLAYLSVRHPQSLWGKSLNWMSQSGVALPGVLTALGLSLVFGAVAPKLNFSIFALVLAFLIHFFAQGLMMTRA